MRGQSEAVGALVLSLMILFMLVATSIILRQQAQVIRYNMKLADIIARRQMENIAFDYRDGAIYAIPSVEMDVLAVVVYNDTSVVYVNTSRIRLSVNQWTPLITDPLASDVYNLKYVLGVITSTGNLLTWIPPVTKLVNRTVLVSEVPTGFSIYFVGNNSRMMFSYNISAYAEATSGSTYNCYATVSFNVTPAWSPILVVYRGSPSITETWHGSRVNITIRGSSGSVNMSVFANGTLASRSLNAVRRGYIRIFVNDPATNLTGVFDASTYDLGDSVVAVVSMAPAMTELGGLFNASIVLMDLAGNTSVPVISVQNTRSSASGSTCGCSATAVARYVVSPCANSTRPCLSTEAQFAAGVLSASPAIYLVVLDPATAQSTSVTIQVSTPVIQSNAGEGYLLNLDPPVRVALDSRVYIVNNNTWDLNTRANITTASVNVTLPSGTNLTISGSLYFSYAYTGPVSTPDQIPAPPPSPPPPRVPRIFILQDPLPTNNTPIEMIIQVIADTNDISIINRTQVMYETVSVTTGRRVASGTQNLTIQNTPIGPLPAVTLQIPGDDRYITRIYVRLDTTIIATASIYNFRPE